MKSFVAIIIVLLIIVGAGAAYYYSAHHVLAPTTSTSTTPASVTSTTTVTTSSVQPASSSYYTNVSAWQTSSESSAGFSIAYPLDFQVDENNSTAPTTNWRVEATDPGVLVLTLTVPPAFEPQTNFVGATLTVGYSKNAQAIAGCLTAPDSPTSASSMATINGINFTVFNSSDVGAGQIYKTTSYRTVHAGTCYVVEYSVHSAELGNYPPSYGLTQYSDPMIDQVLNRVVGTFRFL